MTWRPVAWSQAGAQRLPLIPPHPWLCPSSGVAGSWALARWSGGSHRPSAPPFWRFPAPGLALYHIQDRGLEPGGFPRAFPEPRSPRICFLSEAWVPQCSQEKGFLEEEGRALLPRRGGRLFHASGPRMQKSGRQHARPPPAPSALPVGARRAHTRFLSHRSPHPAAHGRWLRAALAALRRGPPGRAGPARAPVAPGPRARPRAAAARLTTLQTSLGRVSALPVTPPAGGAAGARRGGVEERGPPRLRRALAAAPGVGLGLRVGVSDVRFSVMAAVRPSGSRAGSSTGHFLSLLVPAPLRASRRTSQHPARSRRTSHLVVRAWGPEAGETAWSGARAAPGRRADSQWLRASHSFGPLRLKHLFVKWG